MAALFVTDPFKGNINPGKAEGAKLFCQATVDIPTDDKFDITIENAKKFMSTLQKDATFFGWESLLNIRVDDLGREVNLLGDHSSISAADTTRQADTTWGNTARNFADPIPNNRVPTLINPANVPAEQPIFYRQVRSKMIAKRLLAYLKTSDLEHLKTRVVDYTWINNVDEETDGSTILGHLLSRANPFTRVRVADLKLYLCTAASAKFKHNVSDLTAYMSKTYRELTERGGTHEDYLRDLFNVLGAVLNDNFLQYMADERHKWEMGDDPTPDSIISKAVTLFNSAVIPNKGKTEESRDAKILALTTIANNLIKENESKKVSLATNNNSAGSNINIEKWLKKKTTNQIMKEGKTWYWCPHHKLTGDFQDYRTIRDQIYIR